MSNSRRPSVISPNADEEESQNYQAVKDERHRQLSMASAARATIVASRLLNLSKRRKSDSVSHQRRVSKVTSQVFENKAFMDRVKQKDHVGGLQVGHVDVQLPDEAPVHVKGPVEVEVDKRESQSSFIPDPWNPDKASSSDTQTAFVMAHRCIVGLCTSDKLDEFERSCVNLLVEAMAPTEETLRQSTADLQNPELVVTQIRKDMKNRLSDIDSFKEHYATFDSFKTWKKSERKSVAKILTDTEAFVQNSDQFIKAQRQALEAAMNTNVDENKPQTPVADDEECCSWCFPKKTPPPPPPQRKSNVGENHRRSSAGLSLIRSKSDGNEGSVPFPISPDLGLVWIIVYLLRYFNKSSNVTIRVGNDGIQKQEKNFVWLNDLSLFILDCWCRRYGISEGRRALMLLNFLTGYPQITSKYFWDAIDLYEPIAEIQQSKMLRIKESGELLRLASFSSKWCKACLSAYHDNFNGDIMYKGLGECVRLAIICRHITSSPDHLAQQTDSSYIDKICENALYDRYQYVIEAARVLKDAHIAKQIAAKPAPPPSEDNSRYKVGRRRSSTPALVAPSHQEINREDCRIVSSLHLIYVMQLLQKEIDSDINEFGPILQSAAGFNAAEETSTLYFPLIWEDFKKFLDIQTLLIEEDRRIMGNAPESLDPYVFQLYSELRKLYEFFAPNVDLPDIHVGEHFAPFVERWLEVQKEQFSSNRVDSAINSDNWLALGDTMCTTSVIDLFALLYPLADAFQHAPFSSDQAITFADLLSETVKYYVKRLADLVLDDISKPDREITEVIALRMNDIQISKVKLSDMLKDINLEKAYGQPPKLTENTAEDLDFAEFLGEGIDKSTLDQLQCKETFKFIQQVMESLAYELAVSMIDLWAALITELILHKPLDDPMDLDSVEDFLSPLWEDLSTKIEEATKIIFETTILLKSMLYCVVECMESHLLPRSIKSVLNDSQLRRLNHALELSNELFRYYGLEQTAINSVKSVIRVHYLLDLHLGETTSLTAVWDSLPDEKEKMTESERTGSAPYLNREHIRRILVRRKDISNDEIAVAFLRSHKKPGWF